MRISKCKQCELDERRAQQRSDDIVDSAGVDTAANYGHFLNNEFDLDEHHHHDDRAAGSPRREPQTRRWPDHRQSDADGTRDCAGFHRSLPAHLARR